MDQEATIKELYEQVADKDSITYDAFRKKLKRLAQGNKRTKNRLSRSMGVSPESDLTPSRAFVAYDGEGWDDKYVLLANSEGESISNPDGLTTRECLEFLSSKFERPVYRVFFSFSYDINHIIRDFSDEQIETLLSGKTVEYEGFRVSYTPGKIFTVNNFRYFDVFSFFATSFLNTVSKMLGPQFVTDTLKEGKSGRGSFETWDMDKIIAYNNEELDLLVKICDKLKRSFEYIGVRLTQWYGPGAVANYWFKQHGIEPKEKHTRGSILALNDAYYGGRFENPVLGKIKNVYEYDLHSAYPSVMADMPYFRVWTRKQEFEHNPYSVWYVTFDLRANQLLVPQYRTSRHPHNFMPLPVRSKSGRVCFPMVGKGWYWYNELKVAMDYFPEGTFTIHEGYVAETEGHPFSWVRDLYNKRLAYKKAGNQSEYAIKVGLNSLYGKTAQKIGNNKFFSLSWAGFITSTTRANLARAGYEGGSQHVLGFATDALFTDKPFKNLRLSDDLGDWEESQFATAIFFQSGVYRTIDRNGKVEDRYRGSPLRQGIDNIISQIEANPTKRPVVRIARFISHMLAIKAPNVYGPLRLTFVQIEHVLALDAPYKRHYYGLVTGLGGKYGLEKQVDFSRLLRGRVESTPKVHQNDNQWLLTTTYMQGDLPLGDIETHPAPVKDGNTQRLLEDAALLALEQGFDDVSKLENLTVVVEEGIME